MKSAKRNKSISKSSRLLIILGFFFFINPSPLGLDLIPDAIGCILIYIGLTQLAYFDSSIERAKQCFMYLFIVEAIRLFTTRMFISTEIGSNRLLAVTVFSVCEAILYILILRPLFSGISYYAMRNNLDATLKATDGISFLSFLAFFVRIASTLIPELVALIEIYLSGDAKVESDFETMQFIESLVSSKIILVVLFTLISLGISIAWFISLSKLISSLYREGGDELDAKYEIEYTSVPEKSHPKQLKRGSYAIYISLIFIIDFVLDRSAILPASGMFLGLFITSFIFKPLFNYKTTRLMAPIAFITRLAAELHHKLFVPHGAIIVYETDLITIVSGMVLALFAAIMGLITVKIFLNETKALQASLGGSEISVGGAWISYSFATVFWVAGYAVPYFYSYFSSLRFISACIFIWQAIKLFVYINDEEYERYIMLPKHH